MLPSDPSSLRQYRGRFAPSPSGPLHFGSLVAALGSWLCARAAQGRWLVRMEDIDPLREQPGASDHILATLARFGMVSDEPVRFQSARRERYREVLVALAHRDMAYPCTCSRQQLQAFAGIHPAQCPAPVDPTRTPAWRVRVAGTEPITFEDGVCGRVTQDVVREVGDFVIWRHDDWPAYQLAVVVDDAEQGITEVVRGADLLDSTPRQIVLQKLIGLPKPEYVHLPLALDPEGRKLSKSDAARPVDPLDPMPALRAALCFLGQDTQDAAFDVRTVLDKALAGFDRKEIPSTNTRLIAALDQPAG
ncbi:MAG: tRNA glutamyl-Q(34) synthetase GluQRS [Ahniella sp.]|nr:tRNA glutamyl-Q(34) synthetase GluQRS [Ahniella sp.]